MTVNPNSLKNLQAMPRLGDEPLAPKPLCVKLPADVYALVEPMENRSDWLRRVIVEAANRELMEQDGRSTSSPKKSPQRDELGAALKL